MGKDMAYETEQPEDDATEVITALSNEVDNSDERTDNFGENPEMEFLF